MSSTSSTTPVNPSPPGRKFVAATLLGIWVILIAFGLVAMGEPDWLKTISSSGKATEIRSILSHGNRLLHDKQYNAALSNYQHALDIDPTNMTALVNSALVLGASDRAEMGIQLLRKSLEDETEQPEVLHYNLGMLYERLGKNQEALEIYQSAFGGTMEPHLVHARRGYCYLALGDAAQAEAAFKASLSIVEDQDTPYKDMCRRFEGPSADSLASVVLGTYEEDVHRFDMLLVKHGLRFQPMRTDLHKTLARLLKGQNRMEEALHHFESALDSSPNNRELLAEIAALK
jgi:tetratricopeptide (TPR) repeat protein